MTKSFTTLFIAIIFSTSFAQIGGMGFGYSGGGTVDSVRAAGSAQNLQGGTTGAIPFQTAAGATSFDASNLFWNNTNKRLGIGVTSPGYTLDVGNSNSGTIKVGTLLTYDNPGVKVYDGLGVSLAPVLVYGWRPSFLSSSSNDAGISRLTAGKIAIGNGASGDFSGTLIVSIVGIGTTSPTALLHLKAGTASANTAPLKFTAGTNLTTPEAGAMEFDGTNLYFTPSATRQTVTLSSDSSLKRDIVDYSDALQKVLAMRPVHFRYKVGSDTTLHVGLIAQELVHVDSSLVDYGVDGEARGVKYLEVIPVLVRAIQEQDARITALEKRNMFFGIFTGVVLVGLVVVVVRKKAD
jgi:hypothetical protein